MLQNAGLRHNIWTRRRECKSDLRTGIAVWWYPLHRAIPLLRAVPARYGVTLQGHNAAAGGSKRTGSWRLVQGGVSQQAGGSCQRYWQNGCCFAGVTDSGHRQDIWWLLTYLWTQLHCSISSSAMDGTGQSGCTAEASSMPRHIRVRQRGRCAAREPTCGSCQDRCAAHISVCA